VSPFFAAIRAASGPAPDGTPYVVAAYLVFLAVIVAYVGIMGWRLVRNQREIQGMKAELDERARIADAEAAEAAKSEPVA
jgi:hypothetical protein